ncbi:hypothetical protein [Xylocopilactobacillus apicola]|uniref:Uncharacterized protein n=1 Tax=Xylocopilactobacillus apicola TaxID=2932184 RepID=A0AAU9D1X2_9LACO|nr:hypothetical protein [Xylocopilactobacillus apicola]BDR58731.1 hypothetical protein XA3_11720 [Xylocopilactobacillus apicola]
MKKFKKSILIVIGVAILALRTAICRKTGWGIDPFDGFYLGLGQLVGWFRNHDISRGINLFVGGRVNESNCLFN